MVGRPFRELPGDARNVAREVEVGVTRIVRRAATEIDRQVVLATPVDKGEARSNWVGTINVPFSSNIPPYAPGDKLGIGERANANAAMAQAKVAINQYVAGKTRSIHLTNNTPHLVYLNEGVNGQQHSKQAPLMFIQKAIQSAIASLKGVRVLRR